MSQSLREQLQNSEIKVESGRPPKEYSRFDDFTVVTDLRRGMHVLFIGGNAYFPTVKRCVASVTTVRKRGEVEKLLEQDTWFDRVFIVRENILSEELVTAAVQLAGKTGKVIFFSEDEGLRAGFVELIERNYQNANTWPLKSNVGPLIMTDAHGNPSYQD